LGYYATTNLGGVGQIEYRNILITAIPEPSTYMLMGLGIGTLAIMRRFRIPKR
jgi:hypothetical protein